MNKSPVKYKFQFGGRCSSEFGIKIKKWNYLNSPEKNIEEIEVPGRNGSLFIDNKTYKNRIIDIECFIDLRGKNKSEMACKLSEWLLHDKNYKELRFSDNQDYVYEAICINKLDFEEIIDDYFEFILSFSAKPFTKKVDIISEIDIKTSDGIVLYNDSIIEAEPIWEITTYGGNQTSYLIINNRRYELKNHKAGLITIDCELMNITYDNNGVINNYNDVMTNADFPYLDVGENKIIWEGFIKNIKLKPNIKYL